MLRHLIVTLAAALAAGCAVIPAPQPAALAPAPARLAFSATATLATSACEAQTAGGYTALAATRLAAAARLRAGSIDLASARRVQALADQARAALDAVCPSGVPDGAALERARAHLSALRTLMETSHAR